MAIDFDAYLGKVRIEPDDMREQIMLHRKNLPHIAGLELGINWVHIDVMQRVGYKEGKILTFYPEAGRSVWI
jgi:hypothetical protein